MRKRREAALERWCKSWWRARKLIVSKLTDPTGVQDDVFWVPGGRPVFIEFKDPKGKTAKGREELQSKYQNLFKALGYDTMKCDSKEAFLSFMKARGVE